MGGLIIGGILFGIGLVILGKCPSAFFVSVSEGRIDALVGVIGGIVVGAVFTVSYPWIEKIILPNLGKLRLPDLVGGYDFLIVFGLSVILMITAYLIPTIEFIDPADNA